MTTTVQQRNGFGSRLFSRGKEFGPVWPLFLRSRKGATRTVRAAAAQAACDPRGRKPHLWSCGPQIVVHRKLPENELHACKEWPQVAQTSDSQVRTCGVFHKKKKNLRGFRSRSYTKAMAWCYSGRHLSSNHFFFGPLVPREILSVQTGQE